MIPAIERAFYGSTWAITEEKLRDIEFVIAARAEGVAFSREEIRAALGEDSPGSARTVRRVGSAAVIPVYGVLSKRMNMMTEISGGTSSDQLKQTIQQLVSDPTIKAIVLDVHCPGGEVFGIEESAKAVREAAKSKRVIAVANDLMASGGYWLCSGASEIVATATSQIGSIGVMRVHRSQQALDESRGIKTTIIKAGEFKAHASPYLDMTPGERKIIQENTDSIYAMFVNVVASGRRMSQEAALEVANGNVWFGKDAVRVGLADRVSTLDDVVAEFSASSPATSRSVIIMAEQNATPAVESPAVSVPQTLSGPTVIVSPTVAAVPTTSVAEVKTQTVDVAAIQAAERERIRDIRATCTALWPDAAMAEKIADEFINANLTIEQAQAKAAQKIIEERKSVPLVPGNVYSNRLEAGPTTGQKFGAIAVDALAMKMGCELPTPTTGVASDHRREVARLRYKSLIEIAKDTLQIAGCPNVDLMTNEDVCETALAWEQKGLPRAFVPRTRSTEFGAMVASFQTTGDFPNLLRDAANKTLLRAFMIKPGTWRQWVRVAEGPRDFKAINRVRLSEFPTAEIIPEDMEYPKAALSDQRETYSLEKYGLGWAMTWEMMINDDLDGFGRRGAMMGRSIANTINRTIYAKLTANPALTSDSVALFHATHANLIDTGSGGAPSHTQLSAMRLLMRKQTGLQSTKDGRTNVQLLDIEMKHLIVPAALETPAKLLLMSDAVPDNTAGSTEDARRPNYNSGVANQFKNSLNLIVEPVLDSHSAAIYYAASDYNDAEHLEIAFLRGQESPFVEEWYEPKTKGRQMTVDLSWGVGVIDYRGVLKNVGA